MDAFKTHIDIRELCFKHSLRFWTVRTWCSQGRMPHVKIGRKVLFDVAEIEKWLKDHSPPPEPAGSARVSQSCITTEWLHPVAPSPTGDDHGHLGARPADRDGRGGEGCSAAVLGGAPIPHRRAAGEANMNSEWILCIRLLAYR